MIGKITRLYKKAGGARILKQYLRTGMWWRAPLILLTTGFSMKGLEIFRLVANLRIYRYLKKKYWKEMDNIDFDKYSSIHATSNKVWFCWFQGMDNAPLVVHRCYESMKKNLKDEEIVIITELNMNDFVKFPSFIVEKYKKGIISRTFLSDILRLELLIKYGGTWIDSTVLCTREIPNYIKESEVFFFRDLKPGFDGHSTEISNWFISAKSNNKLLITVRELLYKYWKENNSLIEYFIFHYFMQLAMKKYPEEECKMVKISNSMPHVLQLDMFKPYSETLYDAMKSETFVHKLTYKIESDYANRVGSYYDEIINKGKV